MKKLKLGIILCLFPFLAFSQRGFFPSPSKNTEISTPPSNSQVSVSTVWQNPEKNYYIGDEAILLVQIQNQSTEFPLEELSFTLSSTKGFKIPSEERTFTQKNIPAKAFNATLTIPRLYGAPESLTISETSEETLKERINSFSIRSFALPKWQFETQGTKTVRIPLKITEDEPHCVTIRSVQAKSDKTRFSIQKNNQICLNPITGKAPISIKLGSLQPGVPNTISSGQILHFTAQIQNQTAEKQHKVFIRVPKQVQNGLYLSENPLFSETNKDIAFGPFDILPNKEELLHFQVHLNDLPTGKTLCHNALAEMESKISIFSAERCHIVGDNTKKVVYQSPTGPILPAKTNIFEDSPYCSTKLCMGCAVYTKHTSNITKKGLVSPQKTFYASNTKLTQEQNIAVAVDMAKIINGTINIIQKSSENTCGNVHSPKIKDWTWNIGGKERQQAQKTLTTQEINALNAKTQVVFNLETEWNPKLEQNAEECNVDIYNYTFLELETVSGTKIVPIVPVTQTAQMLPFCVTQTPTQAIKNTSTPEKISLIRPYSEGIKPLNTDLLTEKIEILEKNTTQSNLLQKYFPEKTLNKKIRKVTGQNVYFFEGNTEISGVYEFFEPTTIVIQNGDLEISNNVFHKQNKVGFIVQNGDIILHPHVAYTEISTALINGKTKSQQRGISPQQYIQNGRFFTNQANTSVSVGRNYTGWNKKEPAIKIQPNIQSQTQLLPLFDEILVGNWTQ